MNVNPGNLEFGIQDLYVESDPIEVTLTAVDTLVNSITFPENFKGRVKGQKFFEKELKFVYVDGDTIIEVVTKPLKSGSLSGTMVLSTGETATLSVTGSGIWNNRLDSIRDYKVEHESVSSYLRSDDNEWQQYVDGIPITQETLWYRLDNGITVTIMHDPEPFWNPSMDFPSDLNSLVDCFPKEEVLFWTYSHPNYPQRGDIVKHAVLSFFETASILKLTPTSMPKSWPRSWRTKRIETLARQPYTAKDPKKQMTITFARRSLDDRLVVKTIIEDILLDIGYNFPSEDEVIAGAVRVTSDQSIRILSDGFPRTYSGG